MNTQDSLAVKWNPSAAAAKQVNRLYLDPYGNNLLAAGGGSLLAAGQVTGRGFLNQTSSNDTGIVDTGVRKYDPTTGAFLSVDPLLDASNPVQWNGYAYGGGNPVGNADPSGAMFPIRGGPGPVLTPKGGSGHHSGGGRRKPAPRSNVRKAPPRYAPGAWWGQGGSAYRVPRHYVDPRARWGVPAQHAGGKYAKRASYQPKSYAKPVSCGSAGPSGYWCSDTGYGGRGSMGGGRHKWTASDWIVIGGFYGGFAAGAAIAAAPEVTIGGVISAGVGLSSEMRTPFSSGFGRSGAGRAAKAESNLLPKIDNTFQFPGAGRSGAGVKNFVGPSNTIARGASRGRVFVTDGQGRVIFDITRDRVKPVVPGQGFVSGDGRKLPPTSEQLGWINELWGE